MKYPDDFLNKIIHGDCLDVMREMPDKCVDLVLTDPPYFLPAEHYKTRTKWVRSLSDLSIIEHFMRDVITECRRVLKPNGAMFLFCDGQSYPVMYAVSYRIFDRLTDVIWDKKNIGMGRGFRRRHEMILGCLPDSFNFLGWEPSVLEYKPLTGDNRKHPAEKPVGLIKKLIILTTSKGGVILDPFFGSGTTGMAAKEEGFNFIGIEREAEYVKIAEERIKKISNTLFEIPIEDKIEQDILL